eukprot:205305-Amphidinium_carterae.1
MTAARIFRASQNRFAGTLPDSSMVAISTFTVSANMFTGVLPDRGLRVMTAVRNFDIGQNYFTGVQNNVKPFHRTSPPNGATKQHTTQQSLMQRKQHSNYIEMT